MKKNLTLTFVRGRVELAMNELLMKILMPVVPKGDLSHWVGKFAQRKWPEPLNHIIIRKFAKAYNIDLDEAEKEIEDYDSLGNFFTRRLRPGIRPIGKGILHPADAVIRTAGKIDSQKLLQAKGKQYSCAELLRNSHLAAEFEGGTFITYYLCPTDYHRVHSSVDGNIFWSCHVPGKFWPVNDWSVNNIPNLFAENERVVTVIDSIDHGRVALVMVAATNVGNIEMFYDENICTNRRTAEQRVHEHTYDPPKPVKKGDEIGMFKMGSTVIALYGPGQIEDHGSFLVGQRTKVNAGFR